MSPQPTLFSAPKGTRDLLPPASWSWQKVVRLALDTFAEAGYAPIETPIFEHTEVFEKGVGATSEVVGKQMYSFEDLGSRSLTLRPEGTAPVVRSVLEHSLDRGPLPVKLAYAGPMFRQERPQKGRYRQFLQVGIEAIGTAGPLVDAEVIEIAKRFMTSAGLPTRLKLNSIGHPDPSCREAYSRALVSFLEAHTSDLAEADRGRSTTNPMRSFDSKEPATVAVMKDAPVITGHLCDECSEHYREVKGLLNALDVDFEEEPRLVRGLDYYTRTAFEFVAGGLGSQDAVGGGGRYDGLSETLGGPPLPGIGFALGVDRIMLAAADQAATGSVQVYVVAVGQGRAAEALKLATALRASGIGADLDLAGRSMKGQMKDAARSGARYAVILGDDEIAAGEATIKDLTTSEQRRVGIHDVKEAVAT
jgi:histidyl-tRNA synthetase